MSCEKNYYRGKLIWIKDDEEEIYKEISIVKNQNNRIFWLIMLWFNFLT